MTPHWYRTLDAQGRRTFWIAFAGFVLNALAIQLYPLLQPTIATAWGLSALQAGAIASVTLVASTLGGWIAGALSDRLGRVRVLRATILLFAAATLLCAISRDAVQLTIARAIQGAAFGGEWAVGIVLVAEAAAPATRGRMVGAAQSAWAVGWAIAAGGVFSAFSFHDPVLSWRVAFGLAAVLALGVLLLRHRFPSPPAGRRGERSAIWRDLFAPRHAYATFRGALLAIGLHSGYWALATWLPTLLRFEAGDGDAGRRLAVMIGGSFLGYFGGSWLSDHIGRRGALLTFAVTATLFVPVYFALPHSKALAIVLGFPLGFLATGMFSASGPVLAELYPTALRGSGQGFCYNLGRGVAGLTTGVIGAGVDEVGLAPVLAAVVAGAYGLVALAALLLHETRGRVLADDAPPALRELTAPRDA
ncbi:MFS transporter [Caulobacter sp. UNC279MFTsu5.1]|uniref:MFS transporter n=1 Tax=Caulobacter sp. UNC279MFTsu5.1 TaxID=1502775 RepID=UPI0003821321|nr:MFS transporter [Caulobacter sp. UNC279MFTsu5.1]SFK36893.1 Predicted arabinose efflux permease, MFS family [Caulobacter sp. UNC279MFTsu5.1]